MKILALDFSTPNASLALMEDGRLLAELAVDAGHRRSQELFAAVESLLLRAGWQFGDLMPMPSVAGRVPMPVCA